MTEAVSAATRFGRGGLLRRLLASRVAGQAALYAVATGAAMGLGGVAKAILAHQMSPSAFGSFAFATSFVTLVAVVFDFGVFAAASRRLARDDGATRGELLGASLATFVPLAAMTSAATFALSFVVDDLFNTHASGALRACSVLAWAWAFPLMGEMVAKGADRLHVFSLGTLAGRVLLVTVLAVLAATGTHVTAAPAVVLATASMAFSTVVFWCWLRPRFRRVGEHVREFVADTRAWAFQMYVGRFFSIGTYNMDVLMVAGFADAASTGYYSLASALAGFLGIPLFGLAAALYPSMANAPAIERRWLAAAVALGGAGVVVVLLLVPPLVGLVFSKDYGPVAPLAIPLAIAQGVRGITTVYNTFMSAHARGREMRNVAFILTASNLVLNFALIPPFGATGAAWASLLALLANCAAYVTYYRRYVRSNGAAPSRRERRGASVLRQAAAAIPRLPALAGRVAADTWRAAGGREGPRRPIEPQALDEAIAWLTRTHDATGRRGSSRGYSLVTGWARAFPETTGYIIGTLLAYGVPRGRDDLLTRAREMGDWEIKVQGADGGIMQGLVTTTPPRSIAFNTGMVMHGWLDLHAALGGDEYLEAARRGGRFLIETQDSDGAWRGEHSYRQIPHTYKSRVSWALLKLAEATGEDEFRACAKANLDWVVSVQQPNGWFDHCIFEPGSLPNTHGIAYTLRGLVEGFALTDEQRYLVAARRGSTALIDRLLERRTLEATWDAQWAPATRYRCLTGIVQLGGAWLRIGELTGDERFRVAGLRAVEAAAAHQLWSRAPELRGALPGSFPVYGRYAPLACPNWATKFLADSLLTRQRVLDGSRDVPRVVWG